LTPDKSARREERKVVTVLFADLVGFTARAERLDPEEVAAFLHPYYERLRSELEHFGGTVEKFIGDAVMALFGAPVAHGDDPERAIRAALAIRDSMTEQAPDMQLRIGVNTGEALVRLDARVAAGEGMAAGDVVNTAARLQSAAPVNGILVGESTYRATAGAIDYRQVEHLTAKGKVEPMRAWEAVQARPRLEVAEVGHSRTPFVGRAHELRQLTDALTAAHERRSPHLMTIVGAPGIGKSRLVLELFEAVQQESRPVVWRQGRSLPYGEGISFWAFGEIVKAQAGILESDAADQAEAKLGRAVAEVGNGSDREWLLKHLRPLAGLGDNAEIEPREAFAAWRRFLEEVAELRPLVLVFEDLHWADDGLLDFIDELVALAHGSMLVVCTARPELLERRAAWADGDGTMVVLAPLHDDDVAHLFSALLEPTAFADGLDRDLLGRAGGNPLYAEQYARMVIERGPGAVQELPDSVQAIISARLDALPRQEKELLQDGAVIGRTFWLGAVSEIGGLERAIAGDLIRKLELREFIRQERLSSVEGEAQCAFHHVLVRDVAYAQIPRTRRAEKHRRAAEWIQALAADRTDDRAEMLGHHYLHALEFASMAGQDASSFAPTARQALRDAGNRAWWLGAYSGAARFYAAALELTGTDDPDRAQLLFAHARALFWSEDAGLELMAEAVDALAARGDVEAAAEAAGWTSKALWMQGDRDAAYRYAERALELVASLPASPAAAEAITRRASYHMFAGEYSEAIRRSRETLPLVEQLGLDALRSRVLNLLGTSLVFTGDPGGVADLEQSLAIAETVNSAELLHAAYENLFSAYMQLGQLDKAADTSAAMRSSVERRGAAHVRRWVGVDRVRESFVRGQWDEAVRSADEFIAGVEQGSPHYLEAPCRSLRAAIRMARGDLAGAADDADKALQAGRRAKDVQVLAPALWARATVSLAQGRADEAEALASELLAGTPSGAWNLLEWGCMCDFAWLIVDLEREADLLPVLADKPPTPWTRAATAILTGDPRRAVNVLGAMGNLPGEARARVRLAELLAREGHRSEADAVVAPAIAFYRSVEATAFFGEAERLLAGAA
jgi:class 3 adenylate cyclase/predicted ATPase